MKNTSSAVRFDLRFVPDASRGLTTKRVSRRTVTTINSGKMAFGNLEMRAIFKGNK
jgi:hypothetical protein